VNAHRKFEKAKNDEAPDVIKRFKWVHRKFGISGLIVLIVLGVWWQWDNVKNLQGVKQLLTVAR